VAAQSDAVPNLGYIPCHVQDTHCGTISGDGQRVMMVVMVLAMVMVMIFGVP